MPLMRIILLLGLLVIGIGCQSHGESDGDDDSDGDSDSNGDTDCYTGEICDEEGRVCVWEWDRWRFGECYHVAFNEESLTCKDWNGAFACFCACVEASVGCDDDLEDACCNNWASCTNGCRYEHCRADVDSDSDAGAGFACGGVVVGDACWYLAGAGEACSSVCSHHDGYDEATRTYAGSDGSHANCANVLDAFGTGTSDEHYIWGLGGTEGIGCALETIARRYRASSVTTAEAAEDGYSRACACIE